MSDNTWCYQAEGIIDFYQGLIPASVYHRDFTSPPVKMEWQEHDYKEDRRSFLNWFSHQLRCAYDYLPYWEGDVRGQNIFVGAIPNVHGSNTKKYLIFKQDNNGSTFIVSDCPMEIDGLELMTNPIKDRKFDFADALTKILFDLIV